MFDSHAAAQSAEPNVAGGERIASVLGGAALILNGMIRPSFFSGLLALGGVALVKRGASGQCALYRAMGVTTPGGAAAPGGVTAPDGAHDRPSRGPAATYGTGRRGSRSRRDKIETASDDSFPASDPPAWVPTSALGAPSAR